MTIKPVPPVFPDNLPVVPEKPRPEHPIAEKPLFPTHPIVEPTPPAKPKTERPDSEESALIKLESETLKEIQDILLAHDGKESDIGVGEGERYWSLKNQLRALQTRKDK